MDNRTPEFTLEAFADKWTVKDVVKGILHTIFFHRFFPTVTLLEQEILDVFVPKVDDAELETLIDARAESVARQLDATGPPASAPASAILSSGMGGGLRTQVVVTFSDKKRIPTRQKTAGENVGGSSSSSSVATPTKSIGVVRSSASSPKEESKPWYQGIATTGLGLVTAAATGVVGGSGGSGGGGISSRQQNDGKGADDETCWERWVIQVSIAEPKTESDRTKVRRAAEQTLSASITKIVSFANTHKDHIPPITTTEANPFPYQILVGQSQLPPSSSSSSSTAHHHHNYYSASGSMAGVNMVGMSSSTACPSPSYRSQRGYTGVREGARGGGHVRTSSSPNVFGGGSGGVSGVASNNNNNNNTSSSSKGRGGGGGGRWMGW